MRIELRDGEVDLDAGTVSRPSGEIRLREKERQLLAYLIDQRGRTVPRSELYVEVWGYHPKTKSRSLDTTVLRLRKAIERDPKLPDHVRSEVGVGYCFEGPPAADAPAAPLWQELDTPYQARADDEAAVQRLLDADWPVVTVVGPGGVGKTRLVRELIRGRDDVIAVAVGPLSTATEVWHALAVELDAQEDHPEAVRRALDARQALVVLDEAEVCRDAVLEVVQGLSGRQVLVTSQVTLGVRGEGVHALNGLAGELGRRFLSDRLAASRWSQDVDDAILDRTLEVFDGLPLGLELAASHPEGLAGVLDADGGDGFAALHATLRRGFELLPEAGRQLLRALAVADAPLTAEDLEDWLGAELALALDDVAERSLVERRGGGWRLLRTTRRFVRDETEDLSELRRSYVGWLARRGQELEQAFLADPKGVAPRWKVLAGDQLRALSSLDPRGAAALARALFRLHDLVGPGAALHAVVMEAGRVAPTQPAVVAMNVSLGHRPLDHLAMADAAADPADRVLAYEIRAALAPSTIDPAGERLAELPGLSDAWRHIARMSACLARAGSDAADDADFEALRLQVADMGGLPGLQAEAMQNLGELLRTKGQYREALGWLDRAIAQARELGLATLQWAGGHHRARLLGDMEPKLGADAFLEGLATVERLGGLAHYDRIRAGLLRYLEGRLDEAAELLRADAERTSGEARLFAGVVRHLVEARSGRPLLPTALVVPAATGAIDPHASIRAALETVVACERALLDDDVDTARELVRDLQPGSPRYLVQLVEELRQRIA